MFVDRATFYEENREKNTIGLDVGQGVDQWLRLQIALLGDPSLVLSTYAM